MFALQFPINYLLGFIIFTTLIVLKRSSKSPIESIISNKYREIMEFSTLISFKLNKEHKVISRNIKYWRFKSTNSKFITYFRFIKFYEYLIKQIAQRFATDVDNNQMELLKAINILHAKGILKSNEYNLIDRHRRFRNNFIHDLGMNYNTRELNSDIHKCLQSLNVVLSRLIRTL